MTVHLPALGTTTLVEAKVAVIPADCTAPGLCWTSCLSVASFGNMAEAQRSASKGCTCCAVSGTD